MKQKLQFTQADKNKFLPPPRLDTHGQLQLSDLSIDQNSFSEQTYLNIKKPQTTNIQYKSRELSKKEALQNSLDNSKKNNVEQKTLKAIQQLKALKDKFFQIKNKSKSKEHQLLANQSNLLIKRNSSHQYQVNMSPVRQSYKEEALGKRRQPNSQKLNFPNSPSYASKHLLQYHTEKILEISIKNSNLKSMRLNESNRKNQTYLKQSYYNTEVKKQSSHNSSYNEQQSSFYLKQSNSENSTYFTELINNLSKHSPSKFSKINKGKSPNIYEGKELTVKSIREIHDSLKMSQKMSKNNIKESIALKNCKSQARLFGNVAKSPKVDNIEEKRFLSPTIQSKKAEPAEDPLKQKIKLAFEKTKNAMNILKDAKNGQFAFSKTKFA